MTVTGIISAIIFGLIIGALARLILPGRQNIPIWLTIVLGIIGAIVGTLIYENLINKNTSGFNILEVVLQLVVAIILVAIVAGVQGRRGITR